MTHLRPAIVMVALFTVLAAFDVATLTADQKTALYELAGAAMVLLPGIYALGRSYLKAKAVSGSSGPTKQ